MENNTNGTNERVRSIINIIDDDSDGSLPLLTNQGSVAQRDDDDLKTSEPVAEATETAVNEGNCTVRRVLQAANTALSNLNSIDHHTDTIHSDSSRIIDMDLITTSSGAQPCPSPAIDQPQSQMISITTDNGQQSRTRKHIMISYNRATATTVCQKIHDRLTARGYNVWFDRKNLTDGSILDAMGDAIDDACVVLMCLNEGYSKSGYGPDEAKYARESKVPIIPCMMEKDFCPRGGLGIIKCDRKHIEFFDEDTFDESFEELTSQIDAIEARSEIRPVVVHSMDFGDRFNAILTEHMLSIRNLHLHRTNLDETELQTFVRRLIQEFSPETWQSFQSDATHDVDDNQIQEGDTNRLLRHLFVNNERLSELVRIQQENYARIEQHILDQDERLAAFQRFQQRQEQEHLRRDSNEHFMSRFHIEDIYRQEQQGNDRIVGELQQHITRLTELVINQQEQHVRETQTMYQLLTRSLETSINVQQQQQTSFFDSDLLKNTIKVTVLLCTLIVLFKNR